MGKADVLSSQGTGETDLLVARDGIKLYASRYLQLVLFCLVSVANAMLWITFAPIADSVEVYYTVDAGYVNLLSLIFMLAYIPMVFPAGWVLDGVPRNYGIPVGGLRWGMLIASVGTMVGGAVRLLPSYWGCFAGQTIAALAQPFVLNAPPMLAANWFPAEQRTMATTVCSVANPVGVALGFVLPPLLVGDSNDLLILLVVEAAVAVLTFVFTLFLFRERPPTPPSLSAANDTRDESVMEMLKALVVDLNFWILLIAFGCGLGSFNTLATLINQIVTPYGYTDTQSGALGAAVVIAGLVGSGVAGAVVEKFHNYKLVLVLSFGLATISTALFALVLPSGAFVLVFITGSLIGLTMMPILPISLELVVEITFPMREATPSGLLCMGQIVGILLIVAMGRLIDADKVEIACCLVIACAAISFLLMLAFRGKLKRTNSETSDSSAASAINEA